MADSYRTNQWYDLGLDNSLVNRFTNLDSGYAVPRADNRDFKYPTRVSRTIDRSGNPVSTPLKRGYVRSLLSNTSRRCQFQFNPSYINQSVAQNTSILNFLQADPYQYAQPIPGNVTFNFGLFFDRTMEVANPQEAITSVISTDNPWANNGPEHIGVLHDLSSLFSIIGVGVTEYMDRSLNDLEASPDDLAAGYFSDYITANAPTEATDSDDITATQYKDSLSELVNINRGNSAFLLPLPIRVVFSSLYIVEGLVNDIDIIFTKFSTQMVPIQCRVDISMESKYIGFAKDQTFFTHVLDDVKQESLRRGGSGFGSNAEITGSNLEAIKADLGKINLGVRLTSSSDTTNIERVVSTAVVTTGGLDYLEIDPSDREPGTRSKKLIKLRFPDARQGNDRVSQLFASGNSVEIKFDARVELHRFIDPTTVSNVIQSLNDAAQYEQDAAQSQEGVVYIWEAPNMATLTDAVRRGTADSPEYFTFEDDDPNDDVVKRRHKNNLKLWSLFLNDDNRYLEDDNYGVTSATVLEEWQAAIDGKTEGAMSESGQDDRSEVYDIGEGELRVAIEDKQDGFSYFFLCSLSVQVKVNGEISSIDKAVCKNYNPTNLRSTADTFALEHAFNLDW